MEIYQLLRADVGADREELQARYVRLVESYRLTADFAENEEVAAIAKTKLEQLLAAGQEFGLTERRGTVPAFSLQEQLSNIRMALNSSHANAEKLRGADISGKIDRLPECAEKHYLKAVVQLRLDSGIDGCAAAVSELEKAVQMDPANDAYLQMLNAIGEETKDLRHRQELKTMRDEAERMAREQASREELDRARRREFWGNAGSCCCQVVALPFYLIGACCGCC